MSNNIHGRSLITGGTGFVGQKLVTSLIRFGCPVRLLARYPNPFIETIVCDFIKDKIPDDTLDSVDTLFHLAGYAHDLQNASQIEHLYRVVNVDATVRLAELAVSSGVKRFIFVSSVKAGGSGVAGQCISESDQGEPEGVYGQTKREAELKILEVGRQSGMYVSIVRPSLVYGPGVKGNLSLMCSGIEKGWFPPLPETGNRRSMIHVDDLVRAILMVTIDKRANGGIYIATDGVPHSSAEIYAAICQGIGKTVPHWSVPKFMFDGVALVSSRLRYKIEKLLGDECYSSAKLESLGFRAEHTLRDWTEF